MQAHKILLLILFALSLSSTLISFNIFYTVFDVNNYLTSFNKEHVYRIYPDANSRLNNILNFFLNNEDLAASYFNYKEALHLNDVKDLINVLYKFLYFNILIFSLIFLIILKDLKLLSTGLIITGALILSIFIVASFIPFNNIFLWFHLTFFKNNLWLMNKTDSLILLFPLRFFQKTFQQILVNIISLTIFIIGTGLVIKFNGLRA